MTEPGEATPGVGTLPSEGELPPSVIDAEGNFQDGWRKHLDEDIRGESCLNEIHTLKDMAKSFVHANKAFGKDHVAVPGEASDEAEWNAFHTAGGRPEAADAYDLKRPDDLPEHLYDETMVGAARELFHKIGLNRTQAEALFAFNIEHAQATDKAYVDAEEAQRKETTDALYKDWGAGFEAKKHLGDLAVDQGTEGDDELEARLVEKFGSDPDFIRFAANIGAKFDEHKIIHTARPGAETVPGVEDKIAEAMAHEAYMDRKHPQHKQQVERVSKLHQEKARLLKQGNP